MARLSLCLLGAPQVTLDGQAVHRFEHDKVRALLFFLLVEAPRPHRRDALAGLLWPEMPNAAARNNLRHALANLRDVLSDRSAPVPFLLVHRDTIQFNTASDHCLDVTSFTNLLAACDQHHHRHAETCKACTERRERAVALYRGSFVEGFFLRDSVPFDEWVTLTRERLHHLALHALAQVSTHYEQRGTYELAREYAVRQIALEP